MNDKKITILNIVLLVINLVLIGFNCYKIFTTNVNDKKENKVVSNSKNETNNVDDEVNDAGVKTNSDKKYVSKLQTDDTVQVLEVRIGPSEKELLLSIIVDEAGDVYFNPNYSFSLGEYSDADFGSKVTQSISKYNNGKSFDGYKLNVNNINEVYERHYSADFYHHRVDVVLVDKNNVASIIRFECDQELGSLSLLDVKYNVINNIKYVRDLDSDDYYYLVDKNGNEYKYIHALYNDEYNKQDNEGINDDELFESVTMPSSYTVSQGLFEYNAYFLTITNGDVYLTDMRENRICLNAEEICTKVKEKDENNYGDEYKILIDNISYVMMIKIRNELGYDSYGRYFVMINGDNKASILSINSKYEIKFYKNIIDNVALVKNTTDGICFIDNNDEVFIFNEV